MNSIRLIHCADLHLSRSEKEYSFSVLDEILKAVEQHRARYLILAGDIFDSFAEAEALRTEFRRRLQPFGDRRILFLPGNHEQLQRGRKTLAGIDLGPIQILDQEPFGLLEEESFEILAIPHQNSYSGYRNWGVPKKKKKLRLAVAHAVVSGLSYTGIDQESGGSALDPDLFQQFEVDYAALGHIHSGRQERQGRTLLCYPGSARVWRRGELGSRGVQLLTLGATVDLETIPLKIAGQYREYTLPLGFEGQIGDLSPVHDDWKESDWVKLILSGVVEDEHLAQNLEENLKQKYRGSIRHLEIDRDQVASLPGIGSHPLAKKFLEAWRKLEPARGSDPESLRRVWLRAGEIGIQEIKSLLESRL